jgi:alanyl-tRNA synthetase
VQESDWKPLETIANQAIKEKQPFERLIMSKTNLLEMFKYNKYKVHFIQEKVPDGTSTTVYRCGPLIDLCVGPHVPNTDRIKAFAILKVCRVLDLTVFKYELIYNDRILLHIGLVFQRTNPFSALPVCRFLRRNC